MVTISQKIVEQAASGNLQAFEEIYRAFSGFVYSVALRMVNNPHDAEEITQDVFMRVYTQLKKFRFESSIKTWIYRIAVNTTINFRKKRTRIKSNVKEYRDNARYDNDSIKPKFAEKEDHERTINYLLQSLNPDQRACIILRNIEGLSYEQIAQTLDININTVRTRLRRAREKLLELRPEVMKDEVQ